MLPLPLLVALIYPLCLLWAAITDAISMTIPNRLTLGLAAAFFPCALLVTFMMPEHRLTLTDWGVHIGLGVAGLALGMTLFALRFMGGGDAKLIAAAGLWLGMHGFIAMLIYTALFGGVLTLVLLALRKFFFQYQAKLPPWAAQHLEPKGGIPYGIAICAGGLCAIWPSAEYHEFLSILIP